MENKELSLHASKLGVYVEKEIICSKLMLWHLVQFRSKNHESHLGESTLFEGKDFWIQEWGGKSFKLIEIQVCTLFNFSKENLKRGLTSVVNWFTIICCLTVLGFSITGTRFVMRLFDDS